MLFLHILSDQMSMPLLLPLSLQPLTLLTLIKPLPPMHVRPFTYVYPPYEYPYAPPSYGLYGAHPRYSHPYGAPLEFLPTYGTCRGNDPRTIGPTGQ